MEIESNAEWFAKLMECLQEPGEICDWDDDTGVVVIRECCCWDFVTTLHALGKLCIQRL